METFPVIHSTLSAVHIGRFLELHYGLSSQTTCQLFRTGINHTYIVADAQARFAFRVYSHHWRSLLEIEEEIRLLNLLKEKQVAVSYPIQDRTGNYIQELPAPEGIRYGVLFSFAEGKKVRDFSVQTSQTIGMFLGQMHRETQSQVLQRVEYTPYTLTQRPYELARVHFPASNEEMQFVKRVSDFFTEEFEKIDKKAVRWGGVHLDLWYDNMSIQGESEVTVFDFDFCGNGYLLYDIAYFMMQLYNTEPDKPQYQRKLEAFFTGYQTVAVIGEEEKKWLPLAGVAIWVFYLGVQSQRFDNWSNLFLSENYLKRYIGMVKEWMQYNELEIPVAK